MTQAENTPFELKDGWVQGIKTSHSPNFDDRPALTNAELLVIHSISLPPGQFAQPGQPCYVEDLFLNRLDPALHPEFEQLAALRVSAHFLIQRDGTIIQFVSTDKRAWHAGVSSFMARERCNDFSLGVELEGSDFEPFEAIQYDVLARLTTLLTQSYPIRHIVGHQHIAPTRKTDPGPFFNWDLYRATTQKYFPLVLANVEIGIFADH